MGNTHKVQLEASSAASRHSERDAVLYLQAQTCTLPARSTCSIQVQWKTTTAHLPAAREQATNFWSHYKFIWQRAVKHFMHAERQISNKNSKKKRKKGKFSCRADISGVLGTMPPAASTRSHRHSMLSWKRKEPLKNKLLHVKYSRKHTLWGKGRPRRGKTAQNNKGGWKYVRWSPSKGHRQQP